MRIVVIGASGNVGSEVLRLLESEPRVDSVLAIARRPPGPGSGRVSWAALDLSSAEVDGPLQAAFAGADVVIHLAWLIQPGHRPDVLRATNVDGSRRVLEAVVAAGVPALVYASSVGTYSPGPKDRTVDESWPTDGIATSTYSQHKAEVERLLDGLEAQHPQVRVVRIRPGLIMQREAGSAITRYFLGPLVPVQLVRPGLIPVVPDVPRLRVQVLHATDAARAFVLAALGTFRGAVNIASEPVVDPAMLGRLLHARPVPMPAAALRALVTLTFRAHLQPTDVGWLDLALGVPLMDTTRARTELGWEPERDAGSALLEVLGGIRDRAGRPTAVLRALPALPLRVLQAVRGRSGRN